MLPYSKIIDHPFIRSQILSGLWPIMVLVGQNLFIFQNHYFKDFGFPWDFSQGYYGMIAFWTTLVSQGTYPSWVPYHSMGMPMNLLLQSAIHYPPLWIFPILNLEYSLHAAVVFQCLHVLFGGIGVYFFILSVVKNCRYAKTYALLGAFLFQLFGGFFSNSEHIDIIRAFAFAPWLFYIFLIPNPLDIKTTRRYLIIPLIVLFVITGAYPGNIISSILIMGAFYLFQLIKLYIDKVNISSLISYSGIVFLVVVLGFGLSANHLGPSWFFKDYLFRTEQIGEMPYLSLGIEHLPALFLDNSLVPGEISMTSTYLTLPALILVSLIPLRLIKENWPIFGVFLLSLFMAAGPDSFIWFLLSKFIESFQYSRFPISDFRVFIAIALIFFAIMSIKSLVENGISWRSFLFRIAFTFLWFFQGVYVSYPILRSTSVYQVVAIYCLTILILSVYIFYREKFMISGTLLFAMFIMVSFDAGRVLPKMGAWQLPAISNYYQSLGWPLEVNGRLVTYDIIKNIPNQRPRRIIKDTYINYSWEGFITGQYIFLDFLSPNMLTSTTKILDESILRNYMLKEWTPLIFHVFPDSNPAGNINISLDQLETTIKLPWNPSSGSIQQIQYGINEINYNVTLPRSILMVENEMYFPGWKAQLISDKKEIEIQAVSVNNIFRAWILPPGNYRMKSYFVFPFDQGFKAISIISVLVWIYSGYYHIKRAFRNSQSK